MNTQEMAIDKYFYIRKWKKKINNQMFHKKKKLKWYTLIIYVTFTSKKNPEL